MFALTFQAHETEYFRLGNIWSSWKGTVPFPMRFSRPWVLGYSLFSFFNGFKCYLKVNN